MSKAPRIEHIEKVGEEKKLRIIESDVLGLLYSRARKYYLRLRRKNTGTGIEKPYEEYYTQLGLSKDEADQLFYNYLIKKYPDLVKLIKEYSK